MDGLSEAGYRNLAADAPIVDVGVAGTRVAAPVWRYWTLSLLVAMATFSMVDKMLITVLLDPLKHDFQLTDTQLGLLTGISFSLFFAIAGIPLGMAAIAIRDPLIFTGFWMVGGTAWYGASYGACQTLVQPRMRATMAAILLLLTTLLGFGVGPLLTGAISDYFAPSVGVMSVGYGMVGANLLALWGGVHFLLASRTLRRDLRVASGAPAPV
jgi:hypothetical protein